MSDRLSPDESMLALFGAVKPLIGVVHFLPLPGSPGFARDLGMGPILEAARRDVVACQEAGVDALLFCNEEDLPYSTEVGAGQTAAAAAVIGALGAELSVPFGIDLLWDGLATLAVAKAVGAAFVREVYVGVYESDMGTLQPDPGRAFAYRHALGADDVAVFTNLTPEFASPLGTRSVARRCEGARAFGCAAALISGPRAGEPLRFADLEEAKASTPDMPVLANTGVRHDTVERILEAADGVIVGTALKVDGRTSNAIDPERVRQMVDHVRAAREHHLQGRRPRSGSAGEPLPA